VFGVHTLDGFALLLGRAQFVVGVDSFDNENLPVQLNLPGHFGDQPPPARIDAARFQRAPEGSGQSAARRGHQVIDRCRTGRESLR
jgi:hypothetical protein